MFFGKTVKGIFSLLGSQVMDLAINASLCTSLKTNKQNMSSFGYLNEVEAKKHEITAPVPVQYRRNADCLSP